MADGSNGTFKTLALWLLGAVASLLLLGIGAFISSVTGSLSRLDAIQLGHAERIRAVESTATYYDKRLERLEGTLQNHDAVMQRDMERLRELSRPALPGRRP
jgi:hypothetical protein